MFLRMTVAALALGVLCLFAAAVLAQTPERVPHLGEEGQKAYQNYLTLKSNRAFAISERGGYGTGFDLPTPEAAMRNAMPGCQRRDPGGSCKVYSLNGQVVWGKSEAEALRQVAGAQRPPADTSPEPAPPGDDSVPLTWSKARVYIPGHTPVLPNNAPVFRLMENPETAALLGTITPKATIIYLHGCNGFHSGNETDGRWLSRSGYLVIMPDSFARPGRPSHCAAGLLPPGMRRDPFMPASVERRMSEIRYALAQTQKLAAVDSQRLVLWGHSEGGKTAVWYPGNEFRAHVATGDDCSTANVPGMNTLKEKPVVVILFNTDSSIMTSRGRVQSCTRWSEGRNLKEVRYDGSAHWPGNYAEVRAEMLTFLCAQVGRVDDVKCKLDASTTPSRPAESNGSRPEDQG